ncbi:MAG TPA: response regulator [Rhodocyclaceae bacterium]
MPDNGALSDTSFSIDEVMDALAAANAGAAHAKGLEFVVHRSRDLPANLTGDGAALGRALSRLVENAVRFTTHGEVSIAAEPEPRSGGPETVGVRFSVTDTGSGIEPRIAALLDPARHPARSRPEAAASGLQAVDAWVRSAGGRLEVASAPGVGSDVSFALRFGIAATSGPAVPGCEGLHALVVDDNDNARHALEHLLAAARCSVVAVSDGREALEALASRGRAAFDVAFVDDRMPGMDGLETLRCIAGTARPRPRCVVVAEPARHDEIAARARRLSVPVDDILAKPVDAALLYRLVAAAHGAAARSGRPPSRPVPPIDDAAALKRLGGSADLLSRLLADFELNQADAARCVDELIAAGRCEEAAHRAHTVKGTAMILGLERLAAVAAPLDKALRLGDAAAGRALLVPFAAELAEALDACALWRAAQPAVPEDAPCPPPAPDSLRPMLEELAALAGRGSMSALGPARELAKLLCGTRHGGAAREISEALDRLDFAGARDGLARLAKELDAPG